MKTPTLSWIPFSLSLVSIIGIKKFHISTSTSTIILEIQIKKHFLFFSIFSQLSWQPNSATNTKKCHFKLKTYLEFQKHLALSQWLFSTSSTSLAHGVILTISLSFSLKWVHSLYRLSHWIAMAIALTQRTRTFQNWFRSSKPCIEVNILTESKRFW